MRSLGWALLQDDWCPYRKGRFGGRRKKQGGDGFRSRREVRSRPPLRRTSPDNAWRADFWAAGVDSKFLRCYVMAAPANLHPVDAEKLEGGEGRPAVRSGVGRATSTTSSFQSPVLVVPSHWKVPGGRDGVRRDPTDQCCGTSLAPVRSLWSLLPIF